MWCDGCRAQQIAAWELGDGTRRCLRCINEARATAEVAELNRGLLARPKSVAEMLAARIHASAHSRGPVEGCSECEVPKY